MSYEGMYILHLLRSNEENVYKKIVETYGHGRPPKPENETDATA